MRQSRDGADGPPPNALLTTGRVAETFWMPPVEDSLQPDAPLHPQGREVATVRRLRRGRRRAHVAKSGTRLRDRMAARRRRRVLGRLNAVELQNLAQIVKRLES